MAARVDDGESLRRQFAENGYLILRNFYDFGVDIQPIQVAIAKIVALTATKYGLEVDATNPEMAMKRGYTELINVNRTYGGEVYDAIKQIPSFTKLISSERNTKLFETLRQNSIPGLAGNGHGIRIDNPGDTKFSAQWHQEFINQLRSLDGVVFWSPLLPITPELGPVELCPKSHLDGPVSVFQTDGGAGRSGAYSWFLHNEQELLARYERLAPLTNPGDLLVMDFLTLHASGENRATFPRWTMQWRYFNFADPIGVRIGWKGSFTSGTKFQDLFPELVANAPARAV